MQQVKRIITTILLTLPVLAVMSQITSASSFTVDGIKVIYKPTVKNIVNISVYFRGGVGNYTAKQAGIEKMALEGALECGNAKYSKNDFDNKSDLMGLRLTAVAGLDDGKISLNCITKYVNEGWDLLAAAITSPAYTEDAFGQLRQKMIAQVKEAEGNPDRRVRTLAILNAFDGTPYATDPDGNEPNLSSFAVKDVRDYYFKTLLNKSRMFIVVVGNISKEDISAKISAAFAALPASNYEQHVPQPPLFSKNTVKVEQRTMATNYILGIVNAPAYSSPDFVPFMLSFSELHGIMFTEIRSRRHLSYSPDVNLDPGLLPFAELSVSTTSPRESVEVINNIIRFMKKKDIVNKSLKQIKALYITGNYRRQETTDAMADNLGRAEVLGDWQMAGRLPDLIQQTTRDEMSAAFSKYIVGINWTYLGQKEGADDAMRAFNSEVQ